MTRKKGLIIIVSFYLLISFISVYYSSQKFKALEFHPRDYAFYLQFSAKLLDHQLSNRLSLNPDGHNFLGFHGTEAETCIHCSLHFEPVKYLYALIYKIFHSPLALYGFSALLFFFPVVYLALIYPGEEKRGHWPVVIFGIFYFFFPSTLETVSYDLRPFIFLLPVFLLLVFSIHWNRPLWEKIVFFNLLFLIREEALIFAFSALFFFFMREWIKKNRRWSEPLILLANGFLWGIGYLFYYQWTHYPMANYITVYDRLTHAYFSKLSVIALFIYFIFSVVFFILVKRSVITDKFFLIYSYSFVFLPILLGFFPILLKFRSNPTIIFSILTTPKYYFFLFSLFGLLFLTWDLYGRKKKKNFIFRYATVASVIILMVISTQLNAGKIKSFKAEQDMASLVWNLRKKTDKYHTSILCDYSTYQAYYDYENVFCYNRLPCFLIKGNHRYYPDNMDYILRLMESQIEYIVVDRKKSKKEVKTWDLNRFDHYAQNSKYWILKRRMNYSRFKRPLLQGKE